LKKQSEIVLRDWERRKKLAHERQTYLHCKWQQTNRKDERQKNWHTLTANGNEPIKKMNDRKIITANDKVNVKIIQKSPQILTIQTFFKTYFNF